MHGHRAKCSWSAFDPNVLSIFQPASRRTKEQTQSLWFAVVVQVEILNQQVTEHGQEMGIAGTVGWAIEKAASLVHRRERATFARNERVAREALRKHPIKADQCPLGIVAAERIEYVACAI